MLAQTCPSNLTITAPTPSTLGITGTWTAPVSGGTYKVRLTAKGAKGGDDGGGKLGGGGATVSGEFILNAGQTLELNAGAPGDNSISGRGGGGGGSGVRLQGSTIPLLIAGAGSGSGYFGASGGSLVAGTGQGGAGNDNAGGGGLFSKGGDGFTNGNGNAPGGGGAGFNGAGGLGRSSVYAGSNGGNGGGGYGGGGGGQNNSTSSAGGGGYSGGAGGLNNISSQGANGGTSINYGTNQNNTAGNNAAGGMVIVECLGTAAAFAPNITATQPACGSTTGSVTIDLTGDFNNSTNSVEYAIVAGSSFSGTPAFTTISSEPLSVTTGTGTLATAGGSTYTVRVRLIYNPAIYTDYTYTLTLKPTRLYVKAGASGTTGLNWTDAFADLQSALNYANNQCLTEIWVAAGVYKPTSTTARSISFAMKNGLAIYGGFVGNEANLADRPAINPVTGSPFSSTLSGDIGTPGNNADNSYHVINNPSGLTNSAVLDGFVITGANANANLYPDDSGGGIYNNSSSPTLTNCSFLRNSVSGSGGAIFNFNSSPKLTNCFFQNNSSSSGNGGAIYNFNSSSVLTNCAFQNNSGRNGGGAILNNNSNLTLTSCTFQNNSASSGGGAILNNNSNSILTSCSFQNNNSSSFGGGAILNTNSSPILINCSFVRNSGSFYGGAIYNSGSQGTSSPVLTNCSFLGNFSSTGAGAIFSNGYEGTSRPVLTNCVLFDNGGNQSIDSQNGAVLTASYSLFDNTVTGYTGSNNLTTTSSPFASTASVALNPCSPAVNAGSNAAYSSANGPTTDLNGQARNYNGSVIDMGALEYQGAPNLPVGFITPLASGSALCAGGTVTPSVSVSGTAPFTYQWYKDGSLVNGQTAATLSLTNVQTTDQGSYSVVVTGACNSLTSTAFSLTVNAIPSVSINPTSATLTSASPTLSLTAIGTGIYRWSTGETTPVIAVTSSGIYSLTLTTPAGCSASASANVPGADLTVALELPQAQFGTSGTAATGNFLVNVFEVGGLATSSGNVTITITAPAGYTLAFVPTLTSIDVSGGSRVAVNNGVWRVSQSLEARQLSLTMNSGAFIGAGGKSSVGLSLTRTTAGSGSTANITVNVADDLTMRYDGNLSNNGYARIISGL